MLIRAALGAAALAAALAGCAPSGPGDRAAAIAEVNARQNLFLDYPQTGTTYLSHSLAHGYQVNYIQAGRAWLWYPGNAVALPEAWETRTRGDMPVICWRHPTNSHNPVTGQSGGGAACTPLEFAQKTIVAELAGDPFGLRSGRVPYRLDRCIPPPEFGISAHKACK